jgi:hypothetical protein
MPIILIVAVLALLFLSRRADASTGGGYGDARQSDPNGPSSPVTVGEYFETHPPPTAPGKYTIYDSAGQPTPATVNVAPSGAATVKIWKYSHTVPGTVPPPPPPPPRTDGGAPPPPPVYSAPDSVWNHF